MTKQTIAMTKIVIKMINYLFMPRVDAHYVNFRLYQVALIHGISIGETSLSFREYDPIEECQYPLKGSESTDNHIKFKDIALICERCSFWEISLWNGYIYNLSKRSSSRQLYNTHRDLQNMSYFSIRRSVTPQDIANNLR